MKLNSFFCSNLNSFISKEVNFFDDVSFLHGINGSGKTTILRAIASLLTPDPFWLANASYEIIKVSLLHNEKEYAITASKSDGTLTIRISGADYFQDSIPTDELRRINAMIDEDPYGRSAVDLESLNQRLRSYTGHFKTFSFINNLPTPIFLGLDRTTLTPSSIGRNARAPLRNARSVHPYFRTQLDDAIFEAEKLLMRQLATLSSERNIIFEDLRNKLVLSMFAIPAKDVNNLDEIDELKERLVGIRSSVISALQKINISQHEIDLTVEPFFKQAVTTARAAAEGMKELNTQPRKSGRDMQPIFEKINPFMNLLPSISIIINTLTQIEETNNREKMLARPLETYRSIMDSFFGDSGKALLFEENAIKVQLPSNSTADLTSLSSGERQIFVLITHLFFNPAIRAENILLIDEPELSLHLKWQRQFVAAIRAASPSTQIVLATHSPEIVYNMDDHLISLDREFLPLRK